MAPKTKLVLDLGLGDGYTLLGIACHVKDYRFCWLLNKQLEIRLRKLKDFPVGRSGPDSPDYSYPLYYASEEFRDENFYLLGNRCSGKDLVDKFSAADYFLFIHDLAYPGGVHAMTQEIKKIPQVLTAFHIPLTGFRDAEYLLEGMEFTRLEHEKELQENKLFLANLITK